MSLNLYDAGVAPMIEMLQAIPAWLDKATAGGADEAQIMQSRLAPDMHPFPRQIQIACDMAKGGGARLAGVQPPSMADDETGFDQLKARIEKTVGFLQGLDRAAIEGAADRPIALSFPNGMGFDFTGAEYLTHFVLPNLYFHATTTYALLRMAGAPLGKADFTTGARRFAKAPPTAG